MDEDKSNADLRREIVRLSAQITADAAERDALVARLKERDEQVVDAAHSILGQFCVCYAEAWPAESCNRERDKLARYLGGTDEPVEDAAPRQILRYRNWRREIAARTLVPLYLWHGTSEWHPEPQYFVRAYDEEKGVHRDFALSGFQGP